MTAMGAYLFTLRKAQKGLSQEDVGNALGVSDRAVSSWETGKHAPSVDRVPQLLEILRGTWEDIEELLAASDEVADAVALGQKKAEERLTSPPPKVKLSARHRELIATMPADELDFLLEYRERLRRQQETSQ